MINTDSVNKQVYDTIREMIISGKILAGERIIVSKLAEEFNTSTMPVRNALQQLAAQGIIVIRERIGYFVRHFNEKDLLDLFSIRKMYELYCTNAYFDHIDAKLAQDLLSAFINTSLDVADTFRVLDNKLHRRLIEASGNSFIIEQYSLLQVFFNLAFFETSPRLNKAVDEHVEILTNICAKKKDETLAALSMHLNRAFEEALECFNQTDQGADGSATPSLTK